MSWTVGSVMTRDVVTAAPDDTYKQLVSRLRAYRVGALPVVRRTGEVVGIVSEADLLLKEERPAPGPGGHLVHPHGNAARARARNATALMSSPVVTIGEEATLTEAARLMRKHGVKHLPVIDGSGCLVGVVSRIDLLESFLRSDESIAREVRERVLSAALAVDPDEVAVDVVDGVVRVCGTLETRSLARIAVRMTETLEGVVAVEDQLRWRLDDTHLDAGTSPLAPRLAASERP